MTGGLENISAGRVRQARGREWGLDQGGLTVEPGLGYDRGARQWRSVAGWWPVAEWGSAAPEPLRKPTQRGAQRRVGKQG